MDALESWSKCFSKTHQKDYWFNSITNEKSWTEPVIVKMRKYEETVLKSSSEVEPNKAKFDSFVHKIAIIVPFRDLHAEQNRKAQLQQFIPHIVSFLSKQSTDDYHIYIIQQPDDGLKFNRGKLLNIGYKLAKEDNCNIFIFHDVDLLPDADLLEYYTKYPSPTHPIHIARVWKRYSGNQAYFGGVVSFTSEQFEVVNGFPNNFWGWGGEGNVISCFVCILLHSIIAYLLRLQMTRFTRGLMRYVAFILSSTHSIHIIISYYILAAYMLVYLGQVHA